MATMNASLDALNTQISDLETTIANTQIQQASGSKAENIVKTTVFIKDMNDFGKINEVYKNYFKEPFPARSCVEVARLPKDVLLEVEAIAWK